MQQPSDYLLQALKLAELRRGFCAPNPAVGAVIVKQGQVLATGYHKASGEPHAEAEALACLGDEARGATLYVTLEPCCHRNKKTPPCTELLIARGIGEVYYGFADPNPQVAGRGANALQEAGISCKPIPIAAIDEFYQSYAYWWQTQQPWLTAKLALSLDGKIAGEKGKRADITGIELQHYTHALRRRADALLTTVRTVLNDDPQLNVRQGDEVMAKPLYIIDRELHLPLTARIWQTAKTICLLHKPTADTERRAALQNHGASCVPIRETPTGLHLADIVAYIGAQGIHDLWVETGGRCFQALATAGLIQRILLYVAPRLLGEAAWSAFSGQQDFLKNAHPVRWQQMGQDVVCDLRWRGF
jgi:diaminohydroxyphosphoribosylaminopyrimidine deaminase/5-amino-6-(5-phosphoribosylamino)uracil reductase